MAEASNTLITRAQVTSVLTPATGRKALVLDGSTIELGDTGQRDISGLFIAGRVTSGQVVVQRVGNVVTWIFNAVLFPAEVISSGWQILDGTPGTFAAFTPEYGAMTTSLIQSSTEYHARAVVPPSGNVAFHYAESGQAWTGSLSFITSRPWPTSLPGVVRGQPVGV